MNGNVSFPRIEGEIQAVGLGFEGDHVVIDLWDGRRVLTPLAFYPTLLLATANQRARWGFVGLGTGVEWPELDLQLSAAAIAEGRKETVPPRGWKSGLARRLKAYKSGSRPRAA